MRLWDPATASPRGELRGHMGPVQTMTAVPLSDGTTLLATGGDDGTVRLWDPATIAERGELRGHEGVAPIQELLQELMPPDEPNPAPPRPVTAMTTVPLPDGTTLLATGDDDGTVRLWDPATGTPRGELRGYAAVTAMTALPLPDGTTLLATGGGYSTVRLWDPATGTPAANCPAPPAR